MAIEIVDLPVKNDRSFHSYVKLPKGKSPNLALQSPTTLSSSIISNSGEDILTNVFNGKENRGLFWDIHCPYPMSIIAVTSQIDIPVRS